ncbi:isoaspartyl peptidase/L-asparaginase, partial [Ramlibacter sp.]|uniref:isoaspartyl peptidase/L-asparaginase family protein n=1 Tax=Ramlibacter sp. TaxID=1917967 RepID=UPI0017B8BB6E
RNPVLAARAVMLESPHVLLAGDSADAFARERGLVLVDSAYFGTPERLEQLRRVQRERGTAPALDHDGADRVAHAAAKAGQHAPLDPDTKHGTVGAVACDVHGHVAAASSTGGMTNKRPGRIGDTPIIGAGCYASDRTAAVAATGTGEAFLRGVAAYDVSALMEYAGLSLQQACARVIHDKMPALGGSGGLVAVNARGEVAMPFNTDGMYRGEVRPGSAPVVSIYR